MVGDSLAKRGPGIGDEVAEVISSTGIEIVARSSGSSATTVSVIVNLADEHSALKALHDQYLRYNTL